MMCTRPQDKTNATIERPFCSRVTPSTDIGINPNKPSIRKENKRKPYILEVLSIKLA
jgi:hypothetical protein